MKRLATLASLLGLAVLGTGCFGSTTSPAPDGGNGSGGAIGAACATGDDCQQGLACHLGLPGGYCISQCWDGCPSGTTCAPFGGQNWCMKNCTADTDCRADYSCRGGVCQPACAVDTDCPSGQSCENGACMTNGIGAPCTTPDDCASGNCAPGLPGGYCTQPCGASQACPTGTQCVTKGGQSFCFDGCLSTSDCRSGYVCSAGVCDKACSADSDCGGGEVCKNSTCVGAGVGQLCTAGTDCPNGLSCDKSVTGGYCTQACTTGADCPAGSTCGDLQGTRLCLAACRSSADCGQGQVCLNGACNVPCTADSQCGANGYCDTNGQCRTKIPSDGNVVSIDLGNVPVNTYQSFNVDQTVFGVNIVADGDPSANYMIGSVKNPAGTELVNQSDPYAGPQRVVPDVELASTQIPNTDHAAAALTQGTWRFMVVSDRGTSAHVTVLMRTSPTGQEQGGTVPLNVFLAPGAFAGTTASNAAQNSTLQAILARWNVFYGDQASVVLGTVNYYDVSSTYSDITTQTQYGQMFATYSRADGLNLFFVRSLSLGGQSAVAGVAGGIPGPPRLAGTQHSGVVIEVQSSTRITGDDMAHECGHFQGLFHTTELDGTSTKAPTQDLISDTPECQDVYNCNAGYYQLMFPALTGVQDTLTPDQAMVVRANAGIH